MMKIIPLIIFISTSIKKHIVWLLAINFKKYRVYEVVRMSIKQLHILCSIDHIEHIYVSYE